MNIVLTLLIIVIGLVALLLIIGLFTKKSYTIEETVTINQPRQKVFDYIRHLDNQNHYSKWVMADPNMKKTTMGTDGEVGFIAAWDSTDKNVGKGEQEILSIEPGERMELEVRFEKPFKGVSEAYFKTEDHPENSTFVKWGFSSTMKYPSNLMLLFINIPGMLKKDLAEGLNNLKKELEK